MHLRLLLVIACLVTLANPVLAAEQYGYPIADPYDSTILGTPAKLMPVFPAKMRTRQLALDVVPGRSKPPIFFYDNGLHCTFAWQKEKAPLIFLIAGMGSGDRASKLLTMMKAFYAAGFHVITLPSPTSANFIVSASQTCVPGDLTDDAADLYRVMEVVWQQVKDQVEVSSFNLCGYSLGADDAAFVAMLDEQRKAFNFRKVLLINPSVNLYSSMGKIEDLLKQIPGGPKKEGVFFNRMLSKFSQFYRYGNFVAVNDDFLYSMYRERLFSREETGGLIGLTFRLNLAGMIFASDVMTNSGYVAPKNRVLTQSDPLYDYFMVSMHLSFFDYFNEYFYPFYRLRHPGVTKEQLIEAQSLKTIEKYLMSDKFGAMVNQDDPMLGEGDVEYLRELFGPRAKVYPRGGHLGNLEYKENLDYMVSFFR
ncbi:MAG TPA: alpha/beta hydrolase [Geomonas sp.]|nr:alpha/beta hydrolase [Geomonas sp.]